MTTYVCPLCNREFGENGFKEHIQSALSKRPICLVCGKQFRTTQQLCAHAYISSMRWGDMLHAAVYYLARRHAVGRRQGHRNVMAMQGARIAMELLKKGGAGQILLNPYLPNRGEWYEQLKVLARKYANGEITIADAARVLGLHPSELETIWGERVKYNIVQGVRK